MTSRAEFLAQDRELVARVREFRGRIEEMPDDERVFTLGALTGALERHLAWAGEGEAIGSIGYLAQHGALAGVAAILRERRWQVEAMASGGYRAADGHTDDLLVDWAHGRLRNLAEGRANGVTGPAEDEEMLREAGALCAAEIDRLNRAAT